MATSAGSWLVLVGAAPADITRDRNGRREGPVDTGRGHLFRSGVADALDQLGVVGRTEPDVVRKDRRTADLGVTVNRIDTE